MARPATGKSRAASLRGAQLGDVLDSQMEQRADAAAQHAGAHSQKRPAEQRQKRYPRSFLIMQEPFLYFPHVSSPHLSYFRSDFVYMRQNIHVFLSMSTKERQRILYNFYIPGKTNAKSPASLCAEAGFESDQKKGKRRTTNRICRKIGKGLNNGETNIPSRFHSGTAVEIVERYSTSCRAAKSSSPVRILTTRVTL